MKTAFLDSSVVFSAANSPTGGSSKLFTLKNIQLVTSATVLTEVERNIRKKSQSFHLERFFLLISKTQVLKQIPDKKLIKKAEKVIAKKDAVILQEAKQAKTDYLITLDQKHFLKDDVDNFLQPQQILTPKMLIQRLEKSV